MKNNPLIINIRGNSGSGKTYLTRAFMKKFGICEPLWFGDGDLKKRPDAMADDIRGKFVVLGSYANACGGCDTIKTQQDIINGVNYLDQVLGFKVIWLEGLILSTIYGSVGEWSEQYKDRWVFAYLQPPIEECIRRIKARRAAAGNEKPLNEANTRNRVSTIARNREIVLSHGRRVVDLDWRDPLPALLKIIRKEAA